MGALKTLVVSRTQSPSSTLISSLRSREMASFTASSPASTIAKAAFVHKGPTAVLSSPVLGLPRIGARPAGGVRCSAKSSPEQGNVEKLSAAAVAAVMSATGPAFALVDERLSTEGTGLPFGLSNNLLGWIIAGVFGLIWSLFFIYTSTLEEDEESGLSL